MLLFFFEEFGEYLAGRGGNLALICGSHSEAANTGGTVLNRFGAVCTAAVIKADELRTMTTDQQVLPALSPVRLRSAGGRRDCLRNLMPVESPRNYD